MCTLNRHLLAAALSLLLGASTMALADEASDRAALEAAAQTWIKEFNVRNADGMAALTTEDVVLLDPGVPPVSGRESVRETWRRAAAAARGQGATATKEIAISGDIAWRIGAFAQTLPSGEVWSRGQSLEIWKRVNGAWKIHRQMPSPVLARPLLAPRPVPSEPVLDTPTD
jgi:ketosteroid isomerase-like protein